MSLLEWFSEPYNPGPTGSIDVGSDEPDDDGEPPKRWMIWLTVLIGLGLSGIGLYWVFYNIGYAGWSHVLLKLCCLVVYVLISHNVTPRPDYSNVGWLGGLADNPFRISDDYNRVADIQPGSAVSRKANRLCSNNELVHWAIHLQKNNETDMSKTIVPET